MLGNKPIKRGPFTRGSPPQQIVVRRWLQSGLRPINCSHGEFATGILPS
jgi:hypothetical protein